MQAIFGKSQKTASGTLQRKCRDNPMRIMLYLSSEKFFGDLNNNGNTKE
jgi:hypothetical protein